MSQRFGLLGADQVGTSCSAGEDGSATEQRQRLWAIKEQIGEVLGCVPGSCQSPKCQSAEVDLFPIAEPAVLGS